MEITMSVSLRRPVVRSDFLEEFVHGILVLEVQDLVVLHEVDLKEHIFRIPDELLSDLSCLFVGFKLRVLLARVEALLVRINLRFNLPRCDQVCKFGLDDFKWEAESGGNLAHVNDFVWLDILLQSQSTDLLKYIVAAMLTKEEVILQLSLNAI